MKDILCFAFTAAMPVLATLVFVLLERFTGFGKMRDLPRQIIIGVVFAITAVMATQWGFESENSVVNVRDASPICASFIFGPVAGTISAVIGAAYRVLYTVLWGKGEFSVVACSLSTLLVGVSASVIQIIMNKRRRSTFFVILFSIVAECSHMLLIFLTHIDNITAAYYVVAKCVIPMICFTTLSAVASYLVSLLVRKELRGFSKFRSEVGISDIMVRIIVVSMAVGYVVVGILTFVMQTNASLSRAYSMLETQLINLEDQIDSEIYQSISGEMIKMLYFSDDNMTSISEFTKDDFPDVNENGEIDMEDYSALLENVCQFRGYSELDLISKDKVIQYSSKPEAVGQKLSDDGFFKKIDEKGEYIEVNIPPGNTEARAGTNVSIDSMYSFENVGYLRVKYTEEKIDEIIRTYIFSSTENFHFGNAGTVLILENEKDEHGNYYVLKPINEMTDTGLPDTVDFFHPEVMKPYERYEVVFNGEQQHMVYSVKDDMYIVTLLNKGISMQGRDISVLITQLMQVDIFAFICLILFIGIRVYITGNLTKINDELGKICDGDLDVTMDVRSNREFAELSDDINSTVDTLKHYIEAESKRIDDELALARKIQTTALPRVFPPFPNHTEFDIYAKMITAKKVGGDFYDFFFISRNKLAFLIADVSGKGIPAALFMMTARTTIKSIAMQCKPLDEVVELANKQLCENNPSKMFVTLWIGLLDIYTGELEYVNAGHNKPLLYHDGRYEFLRGKSGFVLAGLKKSKYEYNTITLLQGDRILLYTDGVTEAKSKSGSFYTEPRLQELLNSSDLSDPKDICETIVSNVNSFSSGCEQADDITVLSVTFTGAEEQISERVFEAKQEYTLQAVVYVEDILKQNGCSDIITNRFQTCTDELFSNIVKYAYPDTEGQIVVRVVVSPEKASVSFTDSGIPFDPLEFVNSEIDLPAQHRKPGRLGIFIVKKLMDDVSYSRENEMNKLTITKEL